MSSLAHILIDKGERVSGYDKADSDVVQKLRHRNVSIAKDPTYMDLRDVDFAVYSSAVKPDHPVFQKCQKENIPLIHRSELLHELFKEKNSISVAGSHGKTSTTAMIGQILLEAAKEPAIMLGGEVGYLDGKGGRWGKGKWGVYESDESDGTFLNHRANIKIVTNIDNDHLDYYKEEKNLLTAFAEYTINPEKSASIICLDDPGVRESLKLIQNKQGITGYIERKKLLELMQEEGGSNSDSLIPESLKDIFIESYILLENELQFERENEIKRLKLPFPGEHYLRNGFAALLAAEKCGVDINAAIHTLKDYTGVKRRLEFLGRTNEISVYDDYGHHPTEISSVVNSLNKMKSHSSRSCILFQPHRYTRTRDHYRDFASALAKADLLYLLPIYSAGEEKIEGISTELIYEHIENKENVHFLTGMIEQDLEILISTLCPGDFFVSLGAGNVRSWAEEFLKKAKEL